MISKRIATPKPVRIECLIIFFTISSETLNAKRTRAYGVGLLALLSAGLAHW
jgi:hypothetical protein